MTNQDFADSDPAGRDHPVQAQPAPKWIIIDTETNKLPDYKMPADHPDQPRLAALTIIYCDEKLVAKNTISFKIKPDGWVMYDDASKINGLTTDLLLEHGVPVEEALAVYVAAIEAGYAVAAFGAQFDCKVMRGELRRRGLDDLFEKTFNFCIMRKSPRVKKLNGKGGWPGLVDICAHYGIVLEAAGRHTSLGDAVAALQVMRRLRDDGVKLVPEIHRAAVTPERKAGTSKLTVKDVQPEDADQF